MLAAPNAGHSAEGLADTLRYMANHIDLLEDEARIVLQLAKTAPAADFRPVPNRTGEQWELAVGLTDETGLYRRGLTVELICRRTPKPVREQFKFTVFCMEHSVRKRVYQLDTTSLPLCDPKDHGWPHEHIGRHRAPFPYEGYPDTFRKALEHFSRVTNINFEEPLGSPLEFKLRST